MRDGTRLNVALEARLDTAAAPELEKDLKAAFTAENIEALSGQAEAFVKHVRISRRATSFTFAKIDRTD
ncbi:MAG: hypothetical protein IJ769_05435 [Clostridia bacterium]|nr:hypothetical protein [Clostridia bacterium]